MDQHNSHQELPIWLKWNSFILLLFHPIIAILPITNSSTFAPITHHLYQSLKRPPNLYWTNKSITQWKHCLHICSWLTHFWSLFLILVILQTSCWPNHLLSSQLSLNMAKPYFLLLSHIFLYLPGFPVHFHDTTSGHPFLFSYTQFKHFCSLSLMLHVFNFCFYLCFSSLFL